MSEHTPTPWKFDPTAAPDMILSADADREANIVCESPCIGFDSRKYWDANAAFIVKAVNNHDALVKALTELLDICESLGDFKNGVVHNCIDESEVYAGQLIDQARDALTLVGTGSKP